MSLPRYREYLPTGNPLIPKLPTDWSVSALRTLGKFLKGRGGSKQDASESGIPCIRYGELYTTFSYSIRAPRGFVPAEVAGNYEPLSKGDVLFAASGEDMADIGRSAVNLLVGPTVCGGDLVILRPTVDVLPEFLGFACDSIIAKAQKAMLGRGTTVKHIYPDELRQVVIAIPPRSQQDGIARFLDRETAKIDALIAEQERLIVLLQEKRQAVISHAVTKGLAPNVPMKDTGVEWIGDLPTHWQTRRLKDVVSSFVSGGTPDTDRESYWTDEDLGIPWVTIGDMSSGALVVRTEKHITEAARQARRLEFVEPGMLLISMYASLGKATPVGTRAVINQALLGIAPHRETIDGRFLLWWLRHIEPLHGQTANSNTQANLNAQKVRNIPVPLPPLTEQRAIADFIEKSDQRFRGAAEACGQAVELLRERRTALITAAVTGQIDVRGLVETAA